MSNHIIESSLNNNNISNKKDIDINIWSEDTENILIDWADKSMCFRWLHARSCAKYNYWNIWFTLPIIIISTTTGTANFSQDKIASQYRDYAAMTIGFFNIVAAILTTVHKFFKVTELSESHRLSSISWDKFYRKIKVQLAQDPDNREDPKNFILVCQNEYDNLIDSSPYIEQDIVKEFHKTFDGIYYSYSYCCCKTTVKNKKIKKDDEFNKTRIELAKSIKKPVICDDMESVRDYLFSKQKKEENAILKFKFLSNKLKQKTDEKQNIIDFIIEFYKKNNNYPSIKILNKKFPNSKEFYLKNILNSHINYVNNLNQNNNNNNDNKNDNNNDNNDDNNNEENDLENQIFNKEDSSL